VASLLAGRFFTSGSREKPVSLLKVLFIAFHFQYRSW
jgi:hypothetical protein